MHAVRNEGASREKATVPSWSQQAHLGHGLVGDITEVHQWANSQTNLFHASFELSIRFELGRSLVSRDTEVRGIQADNGHAVVDAGDLHTQNFINHVASGKQGATARSRNIFEVDVDGCVGSRNTVNTGSTGVVDDSARSLHERRCLGVGVLHVNRDRGHAVCRGNKSLFNGKGTHTSQDVATILLVADFSTIWPDLEE